MHKILFLDFESCLRPVQFTDSWQYVDVLHYNSFCPSSLSNLIYLLKQNPDLRIVLTSEVRKYKETKDYKQLFKMFPMVSEKILDSTPILKNSTRLDEIKYWIRDHKSRVKAHAIADGSFDVSDDEESFFYINPNEGFMWSIKEEIHAHLN